MPWNAAYLRFNPQDCTLEPTVDKGVLLVESEIPFILKVAVSILRCNAPDVCGGHHLDRRCSYYFKKTIITA